MISHGAFVLVFTSVFLLKNFKKFPPPPHLLGIRNFLFRRESTASIYSSSSLGL